MASIAAQIAASCVYAHDTSTGGGGYGQNIGAGADQSGVAAMINNEMYNDEIEFYPSYGVEPDMSNFEKWGHYSQIVWKSTTGVGCAVQYCPNGLANTGGNVSPYFTVCNYSPPGMFLALVPFVLEYHADQSRRQFWWPVRRKRPPARKYAHCHVIGGALGCTLSRSNDDFEFEACKHEPPREQTHLQGMSWTWESCHRQKLLFVWDGFRFYKLAAMPSRRLRERASLMC
jgi:hypothetical protein